MTTAERRLWDALRDRKAGGLRFRRQHPMGPFILDFVCLGAKLVVELDGPIDNLQPDRDEARTEQLRSYGYRVLRFRNEDVIINLDAVLAQIAAAASDPPADLPPPRLGEGQG